MTENWPRIHPTALTVTEKSQPSFKPSLNGDKDVQKEVKRLKDLTPEQQVQWVQNLPESMWRKMVEKAPEKLYRILLEGGHINEDLEWISPDLPKPPGWDDYDFN